MLDGDGRLVAFDRLRRVSWNRIESRVTDLAEKYDRSTVAVNATRDNKIVSDRENTRLGVERVNFSSKKTELIDNLALSLESGELTLSSDAPELLNELEVFEYDMTDSGRVRYVAPSGFHDDTVDALALAVEAKTNVSTGEVGAAFLDL